jgi:hypothetical protein
MATKFSEIFAISMLKKLRKFCGRGLTHLDATPTFKNSPNTYETPCKQKNANWLKMRENSGFVVSNWLLDLVSRKTI